MKWLLPATSAVILWGLAIAVLIPSFVFSLECLASLLPNAQPQTGEDPFPDNIKVLIPAHNEADYIAATLESLATEVLAPEQILVIADNCTDQTAEIARTFGVSVLERHDPLHRGKGDALEFALNSLQAEPPEAVIIIDADCQVTPGTVAHIANLAIQKQRPVQATYLMETAEESSIADRISIFAVKVRNLVRGVGITQLGYSYFLVGSGMAFPWHVLQQVSLTGSQLVEDMQLTVDLAIAGYPTVYTNGGQLVGRLQQKQAAQSQRSRWEHGHLQVVINQVPKLIWQGLRQQRLVLVLLALDLAVLPLSLLVLLWLVDFTLSSVGWGMGIISWHLLALLVGVGSLLTVALGATWFKVGRQDLPVRTLVSIPAYLLWKIPVYFKFLVQPQTEWMTTEAEMEPESSRQV